MSTATTAEQVQEQTTTTEKLPDQITGVATEDIPKAGSHITDEHKVDGSEPQLDDTLGGVSEPELSGKFSFGYVFALLGLAIFGGLLWYSGGARLFRRFSDGKGKYRKVDDDLEKAD